MQPFLDNLLYPSWIIPYNTFVACKTSNDAKCLHATILLDYIPPIPSWKRLNTIAEAGRTNMLLCLYHPRFVDDFLAYYQ